MRAAIFVGLVLLSAAASAKTATTGLTFTWEEGEASRDFTSSTFVFTVVGEKVHLAYRTSGRNVMGEGAKDTDGVVKDPAALAAAIATLDKTPAAKAPGKPREGPYIDTCIARGKVNRCAHQFSTKADDDSNELKAFRAIMTVLLSGFSPF